MLRRGRATGGRGAWRAAAGSGRAAWREPRLAGQRHAGRGAASYGRGAAGCGGYNWERRRARHGTRTVLRRIAASCSRVTSVRARPGGAVGGAAAEARGADAGLAALRSMLQRGGGRGGGGGGGAGSGGGGGSGGADTERTLDALFAALRGAVVPKPSPLAQQARLAPCPWRHRLPCVSSPWAPSAYRRDACTCAWHLPKRLPHVPGAHIA